MRFIVIPTDDVASFDVLDTDTGEIMNTNGGISLKSATSLAKYFNFK